MPGFWPIANWVTTMVIWLGVGHQTKQCSKNAHKSTDGIYSCIQIHASYCVPIYVYIPWGSDCLGPLQFHHHMKPLWLFFYSIIYLSKFWLIYAMYNSNIPHIPFQSKKNPGVGPNVSPPLVPCVTRWKGPSRSYLCRLDMADQYLTLEYNG